MGSNVFFEALALAMQEAGDAGGMDLQASRRQPLCQSCKRHMRLARHFAKHEVAMPVDDDTGPTPAHARHAHWKTMTFIAALRNDRIDAPWVLDGPINGQAFKAYIETQLVQTLKPGDIVVLDNLGSHKGRDVRRIVRKAGARLFFLPPYSPDLNPIEQLFSKIKHAMRKAMGRTMKAVHDALADVLDKIQPTECRNYIVAAGYGST